MSARDKMKGIARKISHELPPGYGFFLLAFPFNAPPGTGSDYISNAHREDIVRVMQEFIDRNPMQTDPNKN